eukprot:11308129-Alexandrium_andersonii.AAC.1
MPRAPSACAARRSGGSPATAVCMGPSRAAPNIRHVRSGAGLCGFRLQSGALDCFWQYDASNSLSGFGV